MSERMCSKCALMPASVTHLCPPPDGRLAIWQDGYVHGETDGYEKGWERGAARALREAADQYVKGIYPECGFVESFLHDIAEWAEAVKREAAADKLSQMTQDNDLDDDDWRADGYDDLRGGYYG